MLTIDLHWQGYTYSGARRVGKAGPFALYVGDDYWSWSFVFGESRTSGSGEARDIHEARAAVVQRITEIVHAIDPTAVILDHATREAFECPIGVDLDPADTAAQLFDAALKRRPEFQPPKAMLDAAWVIVNNESDRLASERRDALIAASR